MKPPSAPPSALPTGGAEEAGAVAFVDVHHRVVLLGQRGDLVQRGDEAVHRERAIGGDQLDPCAGSIGGLQLRFQVGHVAVGVAEALGLAQADAVDDRGVVECVGDDRVVLAQQRLVQAAVGIEAGGVEDGVLGAEELRDLRFQLLVQVLRAADEAHAGHAEAVGIQRLLGGGDYLGVIRQAQVVVGAEVEHLAPTLQLDLGRLRRNDDALGLEQALLADGGQLGGVAVFGGIGHGACPKEGVGLSRLQPGLEPGASGAGGGGVAGFLRRQG